MKRICENCFHEPNWKFRYNELYGKCKKVNEYIETIYGKEEILDIFTPKMAVLRLKDCENFEGITHE